MINRPVHISTAAHFYATMRKQVDFPSNILGDRKIECSASEVVDQKDTFLFRIHHDTHDGRNGFLHQCDMLKTCHFRGLKRCILFHLIERCWYRDNHTAFTFKAGLESGDELCVQIDRITCANGFMVGMSFRGFNNISAIFALMTIYTVYGVQTLDETLKLLRTTWEGINNVTRREFLVGTAEFVHRFGSAQFAEWMRFKSIAEIRQDYLAESSHSNRTSSDPAMRKAFCCVLVRQYNKGLSANSKKRLVMEDRG
jgi:hypothetical protein